MNITNRKIREDIVREIIGKMEKIIGPVALKQAETVEGLAVKPAVSIKGDPMEVIDRLLDRYIRLIGPVALSIARTGVKDIVEKNQGVKLPSRLKVK